MSWQELAYNIRFTDGKRIADAVKAVKEAFPEVLEGLHQAEAYDKVRSYIRGEEIKRLRSGDNIVIVRAEKQIKEPLPLHDSIKKMLAKECSIADLANTTKQTERMIMAAIEDIKDGGIQITEIDGKYKLCRSVVTKENLYKDDWQGNKIIRFGSVSDTHMCSKWQQLTHLNTMYDIFKQEGIETVYHAGDVTEGVNMRQGHEHEIFKHGTDEQERYVIANYPKRAGITTKFITGNHDHSGIKSAGHDIGVPIAKERADMIYLGMNNAKVELTPKCILELNHPLDGASYALSYTLQKTIDAMSGGEKPNILINGHHHKMIYLFYRNIHAFEAAAFQSQTYWMKGKRIPAHMGGWIYEVYVDEEGTIKRCGSTFFPFYKAVEWDY